MKAERTSRKTMRLNLKMYVFPMMEKRMYCRESTSQSKMGNAWHLWDSPVRQEYRDRTDLPVYDVQEGRC